jgi:hypothetical protein
MNIHFYVKFIPEHAITHVSFSRSRVVCTQTNSDRNITKIVARIYENVNWELFETKEERVENLVSQQCVPAVV